MINKVVLPNNEDIFFPDGFGRFLFLEVSQQLYAESMGWA